MITYTIVTKTEELEQILSLQLTSHKDTVSKEEAIKEGFVTVKHDFEILQKMNAPHPHIIAKDGDKLVGYALVMERKWKEEVEILEPMFDVTDSVIYKGVALKNSSYFTMGQVCIHKDYRGKGVFTGVYEKMFLEMKPYYDYIITEISNSNPRSLRAHAKVGFETIHTYFSGDEWVVVLKNLKN